MDEPAADVTAKEEPAATVGSASGRSQRRRRRLWVLMSLLCLALVALIVIRHGNAVRLSLSAIRPDSQILDIKLCMGRIDPNSDYHKFTEIFSETITESPLPLSLNLRMAGTPGSHCPSTSELSGSIATLCAIQCDEVDFGIVQASAGLEQECHCLPGKQLPLDRVRSVAYVFPKAFHWFIREDSPLVARLPSDCSQPPESYRRDPTRTERPVLPPIQVCTLDKNNQTYQTAEGLIKFYDAQEVVEVVAGDYAACSERLLSDGPDRVDSVFFISQIGDPTMRDIARSPGIRMQCMMDREAYVMYEPSFAEHTIPRGFYGPGTPPADLATLATDAMLVARKGLDKRIVRELTSAMFELQAVLKTKYPATRVRAVDGTSSVFPVHPGAREYYTENQPSFLAQHAELIGLSLSLFGFAAGVFEAIRKRLRPSKED